MILMTPAAPSALNWPGGSGENFDALDVLGRKGLQILAGLRAGEERRGFAVDEDEDVSVPAKRDEPVSIDIDGRDGAQDVADRSEACLDIGRHVVDFSIDERLDRQLSGTDDHRLFLGRYGAGRGRGVGCEGG
jgi:hypothetical protein